MQKLIDALDEAFELRREQCLEEGKTYDEVLQRWQGILNEAQNIKLIPNDTNVSFYTSDKLMVDHPGWTKIKEKKVISDCSECSAYSSGYCNREERVIPSLKGFPVFCSLGETICAKCGADVYWIDLGTRDITKEDLSV